MSTGHEITFDAMGGLILHSTRCVYRDSDKRDDYNIFVVLSTLKNKDLGKEY